MHLFVFLAATLPILTVATPTKVISRWNHGDSDTMILNFQLAVSQLQSAFYEKSLGHLDQDLFRQAEFPDFARGRFTQIKEHVRARTDFFYEAIRESGADTVNLCRYKFPLEDPKTFVQTGLDISTIAAAAYTGTVRLLENKEYAMANGMILSVESRQAGWINSALFGHNPWNMAFDTSLTPRQAWTALSCYVEACPRENIELVSQSLNPFPQLEIIDCLLPGQRGQVRFLGVEDCESKGLLIVFKTGLQEIKTRLQKDGTFTIPREVTNTGTNFIFVTSDDKSVCDENIVAGPAIYQFDFSSRHDDKKDDNKWN